MTPTPPDGMPIPCRSNPERQFPSMKHLQAVAAAKTVCLTGDRGRPCPWLTECRAYSLRHLVDGVWGGTDEDERKAIRRRLGIVAEPLSFGMARIYNPAPHGSPARYRKHLRDGERCQVCIDGFRRWQNPDQRTKHGRRLA